jgi:hypothetical protein
MIKVFVVVAVVLILVLISPIAIIWSLNTLFPALAIPLSFETWVAALVLAGVFQSTVTKRG